VPDAVTVIDDESRTDIVDLAADLLSHLAVQGCHHTGALRLDSPADGDPVRSMTRFAALDQDKVAIVDDQRTGTPHDRLR
jgi:hypothetical protein